MAAVKKTVSIDQKLYGSCASQSFHLGKLDKVSLFYGMQCFHYWELCSALCSSRWINAAANVKNFIIDLFTNSSKLQYYKNCKEKIRHLRKIFRFVFQFLYHFKFITSSPNLFNESIYVSRDASLRCFSLCRASANINDLKKLLK